MRRFIRRITASLLALLAAAACGRDDGRMARPVVIGGKAPWQPESTIPATPEKLDMVIWEVNEFSDADGPTEAQRRAAEDLVERSFAAAEKHRWYDFQTGRADGFEAMNLDMTHYVNEAFVFDDALLDPERPEFLMYHNTPRGRVLTGFMYYVREPRERGPQIGGPLTLWHYHVWEEPHCLERDMVVVGRTYEGGGCARGVADLRSPEMIHVWLVDRPGGPFSTSMAVDVETLPDLLERRRRERGW